MEPMNSDLENLPNDHSRAAGFRRAILRGLGVVLPPLLTIVVLIWAWNTIENYVLRPIESGIRHTIVWSIDETYAGVPAGAMPTNGVRRLDGFTYNGTRFVPVQGNRRFIPDYVKTLVDEKTDSFGPYTPSPTRRECILASLRPT